MWDIEGSAPVEVGLGRYSPARKEDATPWLHVAGQDGWASCCCLCRKQPLSSCPQGQCISDCQPFAASGEVMVDRCSYKAC